MVLNLDNGKYIKITVLKDAKGIYEYYNDNILIGVYNPKVMKDGKFLEVNLEKLNTIENELSAESKDSIKQIIQEVKEKMDEIELEQIEDEAKENEAIKKYLEENGIEEEQVKSITVMDLKRLPKEKKNELDKNKVENEYKENSKKSEENYITTKDVGIKQEVDLDERATDVESLRKWLGEKIPQEVEKIAVIDSDEMSKMRDENGNIIDNPTTQFGLVAISKDKKVEPLKKYIPQLEQNRAAGNNPMKNNYQIDTDSTVEKDAVLSEYRIGRKIIQLDKDYGDDFEVNIGKYAPYTNNLVTTRMRDQNTQFATDTQTRRAAMGHYKGVYESQNSYNEAKEHEDAGCKTEELTDKEIDGDKDTGHTHISQQEIDTYVQELMKNPQIKEVFTEREVRKKLEDSIGDDELIIKEGKSIEEMVDETEKELEEDASHFPTRGEIPEQ